RAAPTDGRSRSEAPHLRWGELEGGKVSFPPRMSDVGTLVWVDWAPHCPRRALGARMRKRGARMAEARGGTQTALASDRPPASASLPGGGAPYALAAGITAAAVLRRGAFYWPDHAVLPALLAVLAVLSVRRITAPSRAVVAALGGFVAWWTLAAVGWGTTALALPLLGSIIGFGAALLLGQALP